MSHGAMRSLEKIRQIDRANANDYIKEIFADFFDLHGDRLFGDDKAIRTGIANFEGKPVTVIAQIKGKDLKENQQTNFSMPHPEGYRKALRVAKQAEKFGRPVICFVDTPGAFCGIEAEKRGQGEAIAKNLAEFIALKVPVISIVLGEGGSGGALALAVCDKLGVLEHAIYSVISPRGCASILWRDASKENEAAEALKITSKDLLHFGVCDEIIPEGLDVESKRFKIACEGMKSFLHKSMSELQNINTETLLSNRYDKYRKIGNYLEL